MILLAACVWFIDVRGWRNGPGFFLAFGSNPLFAYIFSEILVISLFAISWTTSSGDTNAQEWIYTTIFKPIEGAEFSSLLFALCYVLLCWLVCRWLFVRGIFIKI